MWIDADVWVDLIHQRFEIPINLEFKAADLNRVLSRNYPYKAYDLECTTTPNDIGVYKATKKAGISGNDNTTAYLSTTPKTLPLQPGASLWHSPNYIRFPLLGHLWVTLWRPVYNRSLESSMILQKCLLLNEIRQAMHHCLE